MTDTTTEYRVQFTYRNSYGTTRGVTTFIRATTDERAVRAARNEIREMYGIERAKLAGVTVTDY